MDIYSVYVPSINWKGENNVQQLGESAHKWNKMIIPCRTCMCFTSYVHQLLTQHFEHYWMQCLLEHKSSARNVQV